MIRLEEREDKSSPGHRVFDIHYSVDGEEWEKTGRAIIHESKAKGRRRVSMMERQKINKNHYDKYPNLSQEAITALVDKARESDGIRSLFLERRKNDSEEFQNVLRGMGFKFNGLVFEIFFEDKQTKLMPFLKGVGLSLASRLKKSYPKPRADHSEKKEG